MHLPPVSDSCVKGEGCCGDGADCAQGSDDPAGALEAGHSVRIEGVADGQVALAGEGQDGEHRAVLGPAQSHTAGLLNTFGPARGKTAISSFICIIVDSFTGGLTLTAQNINQSLTLNISFY